MQPGLPDDPSWFERRRRRHRARRRVRTIAPRPACLHRSRSSSTPPPPRPSETRALPDRHLRDLLHGRAAAVVAPPAASGALATVHHRRELRLLRGLGLALLLPARVLDRVEPGPRAPRSTARSLAARAQAAPGRRARRESRSARLLQVLRLLRHVDEQPLRARRARPPARGALDPPSGRDLLLHVHGDRVRRRRLPRRLRARPPRDVRRVPLLLPAPRRRADRAAGRAHPADVLAARPALRGHLPRVLPHRHRPVHEGRDRELPRGEHRRRGLRRAEPALVARGARRDLRVRGADLRRLLRLHEHRDRDRAAARVHSSRRTSTRRTRRRRSPTSGGAGT